MASRALVILSYAAALIAVCCVGMIQPLHPNSGYDVMIALLFLFVAGGAVLELKTMKKKPVRRRLVLTRLIIWCLVIAYFIIMHGKNRPGAAAPNQELPVAGIANMGTTADIFS